MHRVLRLHETSAQLKLSEEIRKKESLEEEEKAKEKIARRKSEVEAKNTKATEGLSNQTIKASLILLSALCFFQLVSLTHCLTPV